MNFYPHHIGDFAAETQFMDDASLGIFIRLIDRFMLTEKPIKTQWVSFAFRNERFEKAKSVLEALFEETEDGWVYAPMLPVIEAYRANAEKNRVNGRKGGRPRKNQNQTATESVFTETQSEPSGFLNETQTEPKKSLTNNQEPITKNQIKETTTVVVVGENSPIEEVTATPSRTACADAPTAPAAESLFEDEGPYTPPKRAIPPCPAQKIVDLYHKHLPMGRRVQVLDPKRKSAIAARWRQVFTTNGYTTTEQGLKLFDEFFEQCATKRFLRGECPPSPGREVPFQVSIDYLMRPGEFRDIFEGKYY